MYRVDASQKFERIRELIRLADQIARDQYGRSPSALKPDGSWVTPADGDIERFLRHELAVLFQGDVGIFGEEQGWSGNRSASYITILDPIDGTSAFRSHIPIWGISLAVFRQQAAADLWKPFIRNRWSSQQPPTPSKSLTIWGSRLTRSGGISVNIQARFGVSASRATRSSWSPQEHSRQPFSPVFTFTILRRQQWFYGRLGAACIGFLASRLRRRKWCGRRETIRTPRKSPF